MNIGVKYMHILLISMGTACNSRSDQTSQGSAIYLWRLKERGVKWMIEDDLGI